MPGTVRSLSLRGKVTLALVGAFVAGLGFPARLVVEGMFTFLDLAFIFITACVFMNAYAEVFSGYLSAPTDNDDTYEKYLKRCTPKPLRPNQFNYWSNFPRFFNSLMKSYFGKAATPENNFCYDWVPKLAGGFDALHMFELMHQGKMTGFISQGFNPLATVPNKNKLSAALSKLKYLVIIDPEHSEVARRMNITLPGRYALKVR